MLHVVHVYQILVAGAILNGFMLKLLVVCLLVFPVLLLLLQMVDHGRWRMVHRMELELMSGAISAGTEIVRPESYQMIRGDKIKHRERDDREGGEKQKQAPNDATFGPVESFHLEQQ